VIPDAGTLTVVRAEQWYSAAHPPAGGWQDVAVCLKVLASSGDLIIPRGSVRLLDQTGAAYDPLTKGQTPGLTLPLSVRHGKTVVGYLTFMVPSGGTYTVQYSPSTTPVVALVGLSNIAAAAIPAPTGQSEASPIAQGVAANGGTNGTGSASSGSGGSGWTEQAYQTAIAYQASVEQTYTVDVPNNILVLQQFDVGVPAGMTDEQIAAARSYDAKWVNMASGAINAHLAFMRSHPAASCFAAAYAADRVVASTYLAWLAAWMPADPSLTSEGTQQADSLDNAEAVANQFLQKFNSYFSGCQ
jgi:hypothetical protein